jgi:hypothetical protein
MKRTFLLGGREITLDALSPQLDATFEKLHAAFYGNAPLSWDEFAVAAVAAAVLKTLRRRARRTARSAEFGRPDRERFRVARRRDPK